MQWTRGGNDTARKYVTVTECSLAREVEEVVGSGGGGGVPVAVLVVVVDWGSASGRGWLRKYRDNIQLHWQQGLHR